jgi:excinuclease ABC subunit B
MQEQYNREHGITPETIRKNIRAGIEGSIAPEVVDAVDEQTYITAEYLNELELEMMAAAESLEFERAAAIRDRITKLRQNIGKSLAEIDQLAAGRGRRPRGRKGAARTPRPKRG